MRRKAPKVVWLPLTNASGQGPLPETAWGTGIVTLAIGTAEGDLAAGEFPIVADGNNSDDLDPALTLADITQSGYRLRRIVGKIFYIVFGAAGASEVVGIDAGFIVRRVDPQTGTSLALTSGLTREVAPAHLDNVRDPWIWRRSWFSGNADNPLFAGQPLPFTNVQAGGSAFDGPHIDQKTARIVGPEERLFLSVSCTNLLSAGAPTGAATNIQFFWQTRVLASMRSNTGNRRNASR